MDNNVKNIFFSNENLDFTYNVIKGNVEKECGYDIEKNGKFKSTFNKMALIVYEKTTNDDKNLSTLNDKLIDKSSNYFKDLIKKKRSSGRTSLRPESSNSVYNSEMKTNVQVTNEDINNAFNRITQERNEYRSQPSVPDNYMPVVNSDDTKLTKNNFNKNLQNEINNRSNMAEFQLDKKLESNNDVSVLPFTLSDEFMENYSDNLSNQSIYNNMKELEEREEVDPMKQLELYTKQRDSDIMNLANENIPKQHNNLPPGINNNNILNDTNDSLGLNRELSVVDIHKRNVNADPQELVRIQEESEKKILNDASAGTIGDNDSYLSKDDSNKLLKALLDYQREKQPDYQEKTYFVNINSADRDLSNSTENRYNFRVIFNKGDGNNNLGIPTTYRNVTSIELVNAYIPTDYTLLPYDNRIFISAMSHPYLVLNVDEMRGVFDGSNSTSDKVFSHLVFDKDHGTTVLASNYQTSNVNATDYEGNTLDHVTFDKQFVNNYYRFNPTYFDKKTFYNNPLASLNTMTINITDPYGYRVNNSADVVEINVIAFVALGSISDDSLMIDKTYGFPRTNISGNSKICKITTSAYFNNKSFKIGDRIKITDISSNNSKFQEFITRDEGHIIINLDKEQNKNDATNDTGNKGYINNIYISPPGEINLINGTLDTSTYHETVGTLSGSPKGYLTNLNLQTNLVFKVTTRDVNVVNRIQPLNV